MNPVLCEPLVVKTHVFSDSHFGLYSFTAKFYESRFDGRVSTIDLGLVRILMELFTTSPQPRRYSYERAYSVDHCFAYKVDYSYFNYNFACAFARAGLASSTW